MTSILGSTSILITMNLTELPLNTQATIDNITCQKCRKRMFACGLRPGCTVRRKCDGPLKGCLYIQSSSSSFMIRRQEAQHIQLRVLQ